MKLRTLRYLLLADAIILFLLGVLLIVAPQRVERGFQFHDLPAAVDYLIGLWGCGLATMSFGYLVAAGNPLKHRVWVQVGIARGALEGALGLIYLGRGVVTFQQAGPGIILAGLMALAYVILYPRQPRLIKPAEATTTSPTAS